MRYFLEISYKGSHYSGWQIQHNAISIQQKINEALSLVLGHDIIVTGSGRTDTGVHAKQQFAHFDSAYKITNETHLYKLNAVLPQDISINTIYPMQDEAHARFSATSRSYEYYIHQFKNPFLHGFSYYFHPAIDINTMNQAAELMEKLGDHDYACFAKSGYSSQTFNCHILQARWYVLEESRLVFKITANRFLRGMVRTIVGTLLNVGTQRMNIEQFLQVMKSGDRTRAGQSVEACGLYLSEVKYPETIFL